MSEVERGRSEIGWLGSLERRQLADLTASEVARALRALSSCYVERRSKLRTSGALDTRGKRAAFALFYGPLHFLIARHIVTALTPAEPLARILDVGCGTGVAGAAWSLHTGAPVRGFDRHPWAVAEANRTYHELRIEGRAVQSDAVRALGRMGPRTGIVLAYVINELDDATRDEISRRLLDAHARGSRVLVIEPIARRLAPWWPAWAASFTAAGGRADEWRIREPLPPRQRDLARAAGLDPRELTARSLWL